MTRNCSNSCVLKYFWIRPCNVTNTTEFGYTPESSSAYLNTFWLKWKRPLTDVIPKDFIHSKPAVCKPCPLIRGNPFHVNSICSFLMANTTIFNEIKWKLGKCDLPNCLCGDEDNAYHYFFVCSKISAFRHNKIVILDIVECTDCRIVKNFYNSSKNFDDPCPWHFHFNKLLLLKTGGAYKFIHK